jgi:hypothetical protein
MDVRCFPTEPGWRVGKSPQQQCPWFAVSRKGLSLVTFFGPSKKVTRLQAEALSGGGWRFGSRLSAAQKNEGKDQSFRRHAAG